MRWPISSTFTDFSPVSFKGKNWVSFIYLLAPQHAFSSNKAEILVLYFYVLGNTILVLILQVM